MDLTPAERRLQRLLIALAAAFFAGAALYALGPFVPPFASFFRQLPFVSNSVVKVTLLGLLCLYAAGDLRRRLGLVHIVIGGHLVSIAAMSVVIALGADTGQVVLIAGRPTTVRAVLLAAMILDGTIAALVLVFYLPARGAAVRHAPAPRPANAMPLAPGERTLRGAMWALTGLFALAAVAYELGPFLAGTRAFFVELPFVTNSVVTVATLSLVCGYVAREVRRNMPLVGVLVVAHLVSAVALLVLLWWAPAGFTVTLFGAAVWMGNVLRNAAILDGGVALVLMALYHVAWRSRFKPTFLGPLEYRTLIAVAGVVLRGRAPQVNAFDIAANVDRYISGIRAHRRWVYHLTLFALQFHPLLYFRPPLSELDEESRLSHLKTHFYRDVVLRLIPDVVRQYVQAMIRIAKQLTYIGYYNDPRSYASVGYVPFSDRPRVPGLYQWGRLHLPQPHPLDVQPAPNGRDTVIEADVCVIGSGAGGAIIAYRLAERGMRVVLVERGRYVEPRHFSHDEVRMIGLLYGDGVFQQAEDFRFTILQGSCVGGSTVVNNAVCFDPPDRVLDRWNGPEQQAGLDRAGLAGSVAAVRHLLCIATQPPEFLNPSASRYLAGAATPMPPAARLRVGPVEANIDDCVGCGYCNIGCAFGKKLSMLDTVLPWAQARFPGKLRILSECEVTRLRTVSGKPLRVQDARAVTPDGRRITIRADRFVVSAGAIASSYLLRRSGVGRGLPVGRRMSFNMGAPLTADFDTVMNAYDGLQISHFGIPNPERGFVLETWWNPPASQAVNMPGWFEQHFENMRRYPRLMAVGVLVGTKPHARLVRALTGGPGVVYHPDPEDLHKLADGLVQVGEMLFAAGARRVMLNTWGYDEFTHPSQLFAIYRIASDPSYITLGTGHPQGGNAISADAERGVVDSHFRVHGYANLYVCDASVFPTSLTVNPQLTVMSLAHYAAERIQ